MTHERKWCEFQNISLFLEITKQFQVILICQLLLAYLIYKVIIGRAT